MLEIYTLFCDIFLQYWCHKQLYREMTDSYDTSPHVFLAKKRSWFAVRQMKDMVLRKVFQAKSLT